MARSTLFSRQAIGAKRSFAGQARTAQTTRRLGVFQPLGNEENGYRVEKFDLDSGPVAFSAGG